MSSASRTNGRPALPISAIPALRLDLPETGSAWLVCPDCRHWVEAVRGLVQTHKPDGSRCAGSAQLLDFDLTPAQHAARRAAARARLTPNGSPSVRSGRFVFPEAARRTARRDSARTEQNRTVASLGATRKASTTMAAAFEAAWERVSRVPTATATTYMADSRSVGEGQIAGYSGPALADLDKATKEAAKQASRDRSQAYTRARAAALAEVDEAERAAREKSRTVAFA